MMAAASIPKMTPRTTTVVSSSSSSVVEDFAVGSPEPPFVSGRGVMPAEHDGFCERKPSD